MKRLLLTLLSVVIVVSCQDDNKVSDRGDLEVKEYFKEELDKTRATLYSLTNEPCLVFPMITVSPMRPLHGSRRP